MIDYIYGEEYTLPSLGKVYDKEVNPVIKLRSMTTNEEMRRLNRTDRQYKPMADILDECMVTKPGISSYEMCIADYQFLLHKLRVITYGPEYKLLCKCKYCLSETVETINLDDLPVKYYTDDLADYLNIILPVTQHSIKLRMQTPKMIDDIDLRIKQSKKLTHSPIADTSIDGAKLFYTIKYMIAELDSEKPDVFGIEQFIKELPMKDTNYLVKCAEKLIDAFGIQTMLNITCEECGLTYQAPFRVTSEFYGPSI